MTSLFVLCVRLRPSHNSRPLTSMSDSPRNLAPLTQIIFYFLRVKFHYPVGYFRDQICIADADGSRYGKWLVHSWHHGLGSIFLQERQKWLKQKRRCCVNCGPYDPDGIMDVGKGYWHNGVVRSLTLKNKDKHRGQTSGWSLFVVGKWHVKCKQCLICIHDFS